MQKIAYTYEFMSKGHTIASDYNLPEIFVVRFLNVVYSIIYFWHDIEIIFIVKKYLIIIFNFFRS